MGLPLVVAFAEAGLKVLGYDVQQKKVESIACGESYIADIPGNVIRELVKAGSIETTSDIGRMKEADAVCICVPTPLTKTKEPDLSYVTQVAADMSLHLRQGQLIVLESTTYPGTTRDVVRPILERSGLKAGRDFYLAYSPERIDPGNFKYGVKNTPKLVGGTDEESTILVEQLYSRIVSKVVTVSSAEVAEMTKIFENVFRIVNIALVNELAQLCTAMGISVWEVINSAATKPYGFMSFYPGLGVGGHCIPLDPYYLASKAREFDFHTRFIELAASINERMPYYVAARMIETLSNQGKGIKGARILILGLSYKKDVADLRESPSLKLLDILHKKSAKVSYNDPYVEKTSFTSPIAESAALDDASLAAFDCVVIATDHSCYDIPNIVKHASLVFDTRGATRGIKADNIVRLGE